MLYGFSQVLVCWTSSPWNSAQTKSTRPPRVMWQQRGTLNRTASSAFGMADTPPFSVFLYSFFNSNTLLQLEQTKKPGKHSRCASDTHFIITAHHAGTLITTRLSVITSTQCWKLSTSRSTLLGWKGHSKSTWYDSPWGFCQFQLFLRSWQTLAAALWALRGWLQHLLHPRDLC